MAKRRCPGRWCGRLFKPQRSNQVFCTPACRHAVRPLRRQLQRADARRAREKTRAPIVCAYCGQPDLFPSQRSTRRYCTKRCRQRAYRERVAQRTEAVIRERFPQELARLPSRLEAARREQLVRAAARGDPAAQAELAKLCG